MNLFSILKKHFGIVIVLVFTVLSVFSLAHTGLPPTHDGEYHVVRFYEFDKTLRDGNWYPLWAEDLNYTFGSPLFNYVYPLPNYLASFFHAFGASFIDSFKLNLILASLVGGVSMYFWGKEKYNIWGGVLTSIFYTYVPYHFLDVYVRGSVGEVWAIAFFPLCLLFLDRTARKRDLRSVLLAGTSYALIIFSHNILAVMFSAFAGTYILLLVFLSGEKLKVFTLLAASITVGVLMSSIFFIPALLEQKYVVGLQIFNVFENFPELFQLLIPSWGSGFSGSNLANQMSFQIGVLNLSIIIICLFSIIRGKVKTDRLLGLFLLTWFFILVFLMLPFSVPVWKIVPLMNYFQFPWRLLSLVIFITALLAGNIVVIFRSRVLYFTLVLLCVISTFSYSRVPYFLERQDNYYETHSNFIYGTNSIGDVFQTKWLSKQEKLPKAINGVNLISKSTTKRVYRVDLVKNKKITFNIAYFPGWKGWVNKIPIVIINNKGKISVNLKKGENMLEIYLSDTPVRVLAKIISVITFALVLLLLIRPSVIQYLYARRN